MGKNKSKVKKNKKKNVDPIARQKRQEEFMEKALPMMYKEMLEHLNSWVKGDNTPEEKEKKRKSVFREISCMLLGQDIKPSKRQIPPYLLKTAYYELTEDNELEKEDEHRVKCIETLFAGTLKRTEKTLKELKDKGVLVKTLNRLKLSIGGDNFARLIPLLGSLMSGEESLNKAIQKEITEETWVRAIEILVCLYEHENILDEPESWTPFLANHYDELYLIVTLLQALKIEQESKEKELKTLTKVRVAEELKKQEEKADRRVEVQTKKIKESLELQIRKGTDREEKLKRDLLKKDKEIEALKNQIKKLSEEKPVKEEKPILKVIKEEVTEEIVPKPKENEYEKIELPKDRVVFLGGHRNLIKKLKTLHPNWKFVDCEKGFNFALNKVDVVFFYSEYVSHTLCINLANKIPQETPLIYINGTNLDKLETQMKKGYHEWLNEENTERTVFSGKK